MNLVWLRKDLRIQDHPAISLALNHENAEERDNKGNKGHKEAVEVVFIDTEKQWKKHHESDISIEFRRRRINQLSQELAKIGLKISVLYAETFKEIPQVLAGFCQEKSVKNLYFLKETPVHEVERDKAVQQELQKHNVAVHALPYDLIVNQPVLNQSGQPFKVFTPYYKKWLSMLDTPNRWKRYAIPAKDSDTTVVNAKKSQKPYEFGTKQALKSQQYAVGSKTIRQKLHEFCSNKLFQYQQERDFPSLESTSRFSAYLAYGMIGPRQLLTAIKFAHDEQNSDWKTDFWLRELAWRDFYRQLMIHFPHISKNQNFNLKTSKIRWQHNSENVEAWKNGKTGFPIIDAAMRQLKQTGWMHNRLRMLTASFFTKLLFEDWRIGEKHFMQNLLDGEFSANNGGWQWSSSTGCDAAPYFRVFNPTAQSEKFDKNAEFIKRFVPELASLSAKSIHNPSDSERESSGYPKPIIDYKSARMEAIDAFRKD